MKKITWISPLGPMVLVSHAGKLVFCNWEDQACRKKEDRITKNFFDNEKNEEEELLQESVRQLEEYFKGKRKTFQIPLEYSGTDFQKTVWEEIRKITYGETISYKELSVKIGKGGGMRAVANACGANPFAIIVPCHRVVSSNGQGGYTGGIDKKIGLLNLETELF